MWGAPRVTAPDCSPHARLPGVCTRAADLGAPAAGVGVQREDVPAPLTAALTQVQWARGQRGGLAGAQLSEAWPLPPALRS